MKQLRRLINQHRELISYVLFGVATTVVNWIVYSVFVSALHCGITFSNAAAWVVAVAFAFWVNKVFVFRSVKNDVKTILKEVFAFLTARILSGAIEIFLPALLILVGIDMAVFGIEGALAKAITSVFVIVLNYILSKTLVFRKDRQT